MSLFGCAKTSTQSISRTSRLKIVNLTLTVITAIAFWVGIRADIRWPQIFGPLLLTICILCWLYLAYLLQRQSSYQRRERRRKEDLAEKLEIPARIKKPDQYKGGRIMHAAQWKYLRNAVEAQGHYFAKGVLMAVLPALALLLFAFQLLAFPTGGNWATGLILGELMCLGLLIYFALRRRDPTSAWIESRIRAELFRREQFLYLAGIGPYLGKDHAEAFKESLQRRGQIEGADTHALVELIPLQDSGGSTWIEILHQKQSVGIPGRLDCVERMELN